MTSRWVGRSAWRTTAPVASSVWMATVRALVPLLFADADPAAAAAERKSIVAPAVRSNAALQKVARRTTEGEARFQQLTTPTPLQQRAFDLLDVRVNVS